MIWQQQEQQHHHQQRQHNTIVCSSESLTREQLQMVLFSSAYWQALKTWRGACLPSPYYKRRLPVNLSTSSFACVSWWSVLSRRAAVRFMTYSAQKAVTVNTFPVNQLLVVFFSLNGNKMNATLKVKKKCSFLFICNFFFLYYVLIQ